MLMAEPVKYENHFLRFLCAVILMFICWTHFYSDLEYNGVYINDMVFGMGRFAIPIFFLISGYFSYSDDGHAEKSLWKKMLRIIFLAIFLKLFYLLLDCIYLATGVIDMDYLLRAFFVFEATTAHAWFVYSLILSYLVALIFYKKGIHFKYYLMIGSIILIVDLIFTEFLPMFGFIDLWEDWTTIRVGENLYPFIGLFFFPLGYFIHKHMGRINEMFSSRFLQVVMILSVPLAFFEALAVPGETCNMYISAITLSLSMFILSFRLRDDQLRNRPLEYLGREAMPWMYVFFPAAIFFTKNILLKDCNDFMLYNLGGPFISVGIQILMALAMCGLLALIKRKKEACTNSVNEQIPSTDS